MFTLITQIITCYTLKPEKLRYGLTPQMWTMVGKYHNYIYDNRSLTIFYTIAPKNCLFKTIDVNLISDVELLSAESVRLTWSAESIEDLWTTTGPITFRVEYNRESWDIW